MSDTLLATLTREAIALPYEEQRELLNSLTISVRNIENRSEKKETDWDSVLDSYIGCMGGLWANENPVEYQRKLREDRVIG